MPTFEQEVVDNQIIIDVSLAVESKAVPIRFRALLDTGAQTTAVSPEVVRQLDLVPARPITLTVASGAPVDTFQYRAWVAIPIAYTPIAYTPNPRPEPSHFQIGNHLFVAGLPYRPNDWDVILGMDFIGTFHITIYRNRIILSN